MIASKLSRTLDLAELLDVLNYTPDEFVSLCVKPKSGRFSAIVVATTDAMKASATLDPNADQYFGVNPVAAPARKRAGRGKTEDVTRLASLVADLDMKPDGCKDMATAHAIVDDISGILGTRPSAITLSGHGLQPFWPISDGKADTADVLALARRFHRLVASVAKSRGAQVDKVCDLPRVLRIPGSRNFKDPEPIGVQTRVPR